jgi:hypothetical protein
MKLGAGLVLAIAACGPPPPALPRSTPPPTIPHRANDTLVCPDGSAPEPHDGACDEVYIAPDQKPTITLDPAPRYTAPPTPAELQLGQLKARNRCRSDRVVACGLHLEAPAHSRLFVCRAANGSLDGPLRFVAPDGSVVLEGRCALDKPAGAWIGWFAGELDHAISFVQNGVSLQTLELFGDYRVVPSSGAAPFSPWGVASTVVPRRVSPPLDCSPAQPTLRRELAGPLCGQPIAAPPHSEVVTCGNSAGDVDGSARVVAPNGVVIVDAECMHDVATGLWLTWRDDGTLDRVKGYIDGVATGVIVERRGESYVSALAR